MLTGRFLFRNAGVPSDGWNSVKIPTSVEEPEVALLADGKYIDI